MLGPGDTGEADQTGFHYTTVELHDLQMYQSHHTQYMSHVFKQGTGNKAKLGLKSLIT